MIQAVVFDLGKVLVDFDYSIAVRAIAARSQSTVEQLDHLLLRSSVMPEYELGKLTTEQFYREVCEATGFRGDFAEFAGLFGDIFTPIAPMVELQAELKRLGVPTYIFSNTNDLAVRHIRQRFPFFANFNGYVLSFEHGAMKPDARLYEVVERESGHNGPALLYLDDRAENVAAGAARGWQIILQESPEKTLSTMSALGLLPG